MLAGRPKIITLGKAKGGSGSTTVGTAFAVQLAQLGYKVAVVDIDVNSKASWALLEGHRAPGFFKWFVPADNPTGLTPCAVQAQFAALSLKARRHCELYVLPGDPMTGAAETVAYQQRWPDTRLRDMLKMLTDFDFIVIDGPDSGSLPRMALVAADLILAVSTLRTIDQDSIEILAELIGAVRPDNPPVWVVPNRYDGRTKLACDPLLAEMRGAVAQAQAAAMDWATCDPIGEAVGLDTSLKMFRTLPEVRPTHPVARQIANLAAQVADYFDYEEETA